MSKTPILIVSGYTKELAESGDIARANHQAYANQHGYRYQCVREGFNPFKHPSWSKVIFLYEAMSVRDFQGKRPWEWIFWIDADAIITNQSVELESFLQGLPPQCEMVIGEDTWGINAGLWFLRNGPWCQQLLIDLWRADPLPFIESGVKPPIWIEQPRYLVEQSTLWHLLQLRQEDHRLQLVPYFRLGGYLAEFDKDSYTPRDQGMLPPTCNSPLVRQSWKPGDFCLHLAGVPGERKAGLLYDALNDQGNATA